MGTIIVTGSSGFIGGNLINFLNKKILKLLEYLGGNLHIIQMVLTLSIWI